MISDDIIRLLVDLKRKNEGIAFKRIGMKIFDKYGELFDDLILENAYTKYKDDPKFQPRKTKEPYVTV